MTTPRKSRPRKPPPPSEAEVLKQLLQWLRLHFDLVWRNNTGARKLPGHGGKGQFVRWGVVGSGDLFALGPGGRFVSVEAKRPGGKLTIAQQIWMAAVRTSGGIAVVASSVEELEAALKSAGWQP